MSEKCVSLARWFQAKGLVSFAELYETHGASLIRKKLTILYPPWQEFKNSSLVLRYRRVVIPKNDGKASFRYEDYPPLTVTVEGVANSGMNSKSGAPVQFDGFPFSVVELTKQKEKLNDHVIFEWKDDGTPPLVISLSPAFDHPYMRIGDRHLDTERVELPFTTSYIRKGMERVTIVCTDAVIFSPIFPPQITGHVPTAPTVVTAG